MVKTEEIRFKGSAITQVEFLIFIGKKKKNVTLFFLFLQKK